MAVGNVDILQVKNSGFPWGIFNEMMVGFQLGTLRGSRKTSEKTRFFASYLAPFGGSRYIYIYINTIHVYIYIYIHAEYGYMLWHRKPWFTVRKRS